MNPGPTKKSNNFCVRGCEKKKNVQLYIAITDLILAYKVRTIVCLGHKCKLAERTYRQSVRVCDVYATSRRLGINNELKI